MTTYKKGPGSFLVDEGLLFEINRQVLHPLGLALAVEVPSQGEPTDAFASYAKCYLQTTDDPEGFTFSEEQLAAGLAKIKAYKAAHHDNFCKRTDAIGHVVQQPASPNPARHQGAPDEQG